MAFINHWSTIPRSTGIYRNIADLLSPSWCFCSFPCMLLEGDLPMLIRHRHSGVGRCAEVCFQGIVAVQGSIRSRRKSSRNVPKSLRFSFWTRTNRLLVLYFVQGSYPSILYKLLISPYCTIQFPRAPKSLLIYDP